MISQSHPNANRLGLVAVAVGCLLMIGSPAAAQDRPAETRPFPDAVESHIETQRAPYDPTIIGRTVAFYEGITRQDPRGLIGWRELAGAYLARQREAGDIADAVRAEDAARRSLAILTRGNAGASIRLAQALLAQHRFPEALSTAEAAAQLDPKAERIVIDVRLELGDYDQATRALQAVSTEPDDLNLLALRARFGQIQGRPEESLALMREAARLADGRPDMPAEVVGWYHTMVGHHLIDSGHLDDGVKSCEKALTIFPNDYRAMTGLAEAAAWRGDHAEARKWADAALELAPQNPEALRLAGEAELGLGHKDEADRRFAALRDLAASFPRIYDRHWVLFCLDTGRDPAAALDLARRDLALRHDSGAHETLAYACLKNNLLDEAAREIDLALAPGTREAGLMHHAALIARARGEVARADAFLAQSRALNPYLVRAAEATAPPTGTTAEHR